MWGTILSIVLGLVGDIIKSIISKPANQRVDFAKSVRQSYDDHQKAWAKAKATGDTSDLEQLP